MADAAFWIGFDEYPLPVAQPQPLSPIAGHGMRVWERPSDEVMADRVARGQETKAKNAWWRHAQRTAQTHRLRNLFKRVVTVRWTSKPQPHEADMQVWTPQQQYAEFAGLSDG